VIPSPQAQRALLSTTNLNAWAKRFVVVKWPELRVRRRAAQSGRNALHQLTPPLVGERHLTSTKVVAVAPAVGHAVNVDSLDVALITLGSREQAADDVGAHLGVDLVTGSDRGEQTHESGIVGGFQARMHQRAGRTAHVLEPVLPEGRLPDGVAHHLGQLIVAILQLEILELDHPDTMAEPGRAEAHQGLVERHVRLIFLAYPNHEFLEADLVREFHPTDNRLLDSFVRLVADPFRPALGALHGHRNVPLAIRRGGAYLSGELLSTATLLAPKSTHLAEPNKRPVITRGDDRERGVAR